MITDTGDVKAVYYCPLTGNIDEGDGELFTVGDRYLKDCMNAIKAALKKDAEKMDEDMAEFFNSDTGLKEKLASAQWDIDKYCGRVFGKITCGLKKELSDREDAILRDWICGQNADGYGEHFEQIPIDTEDGNLYVSFWHGGDDYAIMTEDELAGFIEDQEMRMEGM